MADQRRLHPRLTATDLDTEPFIPELSPVVTPYGDSLMTRPWLDWARRLTLLVGVKGTGGGGGTGTGDVVGPDGATPDAIAVYSGSTGKLIKDSLKSIGSVINDAVTQAIAAILPGGKLPVTNLPLHKTTHQAGGVDAVDVKLLAGYPANNAVFLDGTGAFTTPVAGVPGPHHATHEPGGGDPMAVDAAVAVGSLRTLGTGANQAAPGNDTRFTAAPQLHATTHSKLGTDPVTVTNLAGYPGGSTNFLREDGVFAAPPGGGGGAPVGAQYWVSTVDATLTAERSLGALASGYVKSTVAAAVSTPSTVASIPAADGGTGVTTGLTVLDAGNLTAGTVPAARLTAANLPVHATRHQSGGADVVDVKLLGGYPGGTTNFLRSDGTFNAPTGVVPAAHHTTHEVGGTDVLANNAWTNQVNTFTASLQRISYPGGRLQLEDTSQAANARKFEVVNINQTLIFQSINDAENTVLGDVKISRSGDVAVGGSFFESSRSAPVGFYTAFTPSFIAATGTVTVISDFGSRYSLVGRQMTIQGHWQVQNTADTTTISLLIPAGFTSQASFLATMVWWGQGVAGFGNGIIAGTVGYGALVLQRDLPITASFPVDTYQLGFQVTFQI